MAESITTDLDVLSKLEEIEMRNCNRGLFVFVPEKQLTQETNLKVRELRRILNRLSSNRLIIWDKGTDTVRSRIGHVLFNLFMSRVVRRTGEQRNVADCKYIRFVKRIPEYMIPLRSTDTLKKLDRILSFVRLERKYGKVVSSSISALARRYPKLSRFQFKGTQQILNCLSRRASTRSVVIVADTGAGKTLAYQLPILLWILRKKLKVYPRRSVNCTAMLVFPRNVLAQDQYESISSAARRIEQEIQKLRLPGQLKKFLKFNIARDFGGIGIEEREQIYNSNPDILITNTETLKKRLLNPLAHKVYKRGIDVILYDEIHLYYGLHGSLVAGLNARLRLLLPKEPVFIGMSATIANPEKHAQRLFAHTGLSVRPVRITDEDDVLIPKAVEHHIILKPRPGRYALGVAIDAVSSLLHNRRDGTHNLRSLTNRERPKSISFSDSLDITGRWTHDQNDLELYSPPIQTRPRTTFHRRYPIYFRPATRDFGDVCRECHSGRGVIAASCQRYLDGRCWYFSNDSGDASRWRNVDGGFILTDNMRSRRLTSQEVTFDEQTDIYDYFTHEIEDRFGNPIDRVQVDNLIATSVLEVGVDFSNIKEIIMYGEIRSPTSYKQKAGRGAREENITDGLCVLTIIPPLPLANFYYRHFHRLVNPSLSPIPLEPGNPDSVRSHAIGCVFDFLARKGIDVFNIIEMKNDERSVEKEFDKALVMLDKKRSEIEKYVEQFTRVLGNPIESLGKKAVGVAKDIIALLTQDLELDGEKKKLITWLFRASRNPGDMALLEERFQRGFNEDILLIDDYSKTQTELEQRFVELDETIKELEGEYIDVLPELKRLVKSLGAKI